MDRETGIMIGGGCGCLIMALLFNLCVGGFLCDYCLWQTFALDIPFWADMLIGVFLAEIMIPWAIVMFIISVAAPDALPLIEQQAQAAMLILNDWRTA